MTPESHPPSPSYSHNAPPPPRNGRLIAMGLAGVAALAFAGVLGVRVKDKLAQRGEMEQQSKTAATAEPKHELVRVVKPARVKWRAVVPVTGTLGPVQEADLGFKVGGRLASVSVNEGERVKAGETLATLDCAESGAQAAAARAAVKAAEAGLAMSEDAAKRTDGLAQTGAVSDSDRVGVELRRAAAAAQVEQARAGAQLASVMVSNCRLVAPFGGLVTRVPAGVGKIVGPGEPLFHLQDTSILELRATLSEEDRFLVEVGADIDVATDESAFGPATNEAPRAPKTRGRVTAVMPSLDRLTRRLPILAEVPETPGTPLLAGAFVRARVASKEEIDALALPASAQRPGSQDEIVLVKDGKAERRHVVFTRGEDGKLYVRSGLAETDVVLEAPSSGLESGDVVYVAP